MDMAHTYINEVRPRVEAKIHTVSTVVSVQVSGLRKYYPFSLFTPILLCSTLILIIIIIIYFI